MGEGCHVVSESLRLDNLARFLSPDGACKIMTMRLYTLSPSLEIMVLGLLTIEISMIGPGAGSSASLSL